MNAQSQARRRQLSAKLRATAALLVLSLAALVAGAVLFARQAETVLNETERQAELNLRLRQLQTALVTFAYAESSQRGYLLTSDPHDLAPYREAGVQLPPLLKELDSLDQTLPALAEPARTIRRLAATKLAEFADTVRLFEAGQREAALDMVRSPVVQATTESLQDGLQATMRALRAERDDASDRVRAATAASRRLATWIVGALVAAAVLAGIQIMTLLVARNRYEDELAASEQRHRTIVEEQQEMIALAYADGTLGYANPAFGRALGLGTTDLTGRNLYDFIDPAERDAVRHQLSAVSRSGLTMSGEHRMLVPGAKPIWVAWVHRAHDMPGEARMLHLVGRDVTQRRELEQRLEAREQFIRKIADNVPVRIAYFGPDQRFQFVNRAHVLRFGLSEEAILGRTRGELTRGQSDDEVVEGRLQQALAGQAQRFEYEDHVNGRLRCIESQLIPDIAPDGQVRGIFTIGVDITDRKAVERALRDLTEVFDNTPDFVVQADWRGRVLYLNPAVRRTLGFAPDEPVDGHHFSEFNTPQTNDRFDNEIIPAVKRNGVWVGEATVLDGQRRAVPVSYMVIAHRDVRGRVARYSGIMRDVSADMAARQSLARQTATLNAVIEAIPAMVGVWDVDMRYRLVNRAFERWRSRDRGDVVGHSIEQVLGAEEFERIRPWVTRALAGETVTYEREFPSASVGRHVNVTYLPLRLEDGTVDGFIGVAHDITRHREERSRLLALAERDPLTGLLNRAGFDGCLSRQIEAGEGATTGVLYIDLDRFKPVNDTHGHAIGDEVLVMFASRLQHLVRPTDAVARLGGDEFAIVLAGVTEMAQVDAVARKIRDAAARPFKIGELRLSVGASVGSALDATGEGGLKGLVARADAMSYLAKAAGRQHRRRAYERGNGNGDGAADRG
ncbi:PAS domain-containing protein [Ideonella sp.]|uniref:PAS domain-containing protein n=1 Tax=Ideonella sp. TaxID=1929293 RepID=UPI0035B43D11